MHRLQDCVGPRREQCKTMLRRENVLITGYQNLFHDRGAAGQALVGPVKNFLMERSWLDEDVVVLGLPRGGVLVAAPLAERLGRPFDFVVTRKLRSPRQQDLVIGAVTERGRVFLNRPVIDALGISEELIQTEIEKEQLEIKSSVASYRSVLAATDLAGKTVIVADDNVITGSTMFATLRGLWAERPRNIVLAVPVAPRDTIMALSEFADYVIALKAPANGFTCMKDYYEIYSEVTEVDVLRTLKESVRQPVDPI